jgi:hypothetical protein
MIKNRISYSDAVKEAEDAVKDIADPKLKIVAFETILKNILSTSVNIAETEQMHHQPEKIEEKPARSNSLSLLNKFATSLGIETKQVGLVYSINEDTQSFRIVSNFQHNIGKWSQIHFVLLKLMGNFIKNGQKKSYSNLIIREMKDYGYGGLPNINPFMKTISPHIVHVDTKKKKSENTYELTEFGVDAVKKLIQEIVNNNGLVPLQPTYLPNKVTKSKTKSKLVLQIIDQITDGFFDKPRTINELKQKLSEIGAIYPRNIIDEKIRRRFNNKELRRIKIDKKWQYVKK